MKKKSKIYKNYMNRKIIQIYTVETLQLFTLCLWTMLQHVKVGHIALSQLVISIFGLKRGHLIYLGPAHECCPALFVVFLFVRLQKVKKNLVSSTSTYPGTCTVHRISTQQKLKNSLPHNNPCLALPQSFKYKISRCTGCKTSCGIRHSEPISQTTR